MPTVGVSMIEHPLAWYVDSSVLLRAIVEQSAAARRWFELAAGRGDRFVASRLMEVEVRQVTQNARVDQTVVSEYLDEFMLMTVNDDLLAEAIALPVPLGGADSIHVASALRIGPGALTLVTHDLQMAKGAHVLGFQVFDPVTDDPARAAVTLDGSGWIDDFDGRVRSPLSTTEVLDDDRGPDATT